MSSNLPGKTSQPQIKWDDSDMKHSYANVCNATATREEIVLMFGMNHAWRSGQKEVTVQLSDRIILSPFAAKRLSLLLTNLVRQHEERFGPLPLQTTPAENAPVRPAITEPVSGYTN